MSIQEKYRKLYEELDQFAEYHGAQALVDERGEDLQALIDMEKMYPELVTLDEREAELQALMQDEEIDPELLKGE